MSLQSVDSLTPTEIVLTIVLLPLILPLILVLSPLLIIWGLVYSFPGSGSGGHPGR